MFRGKTLLSICIPTNGRIEITRKTIQSIYADLGDVDLTEFEVIISDNSIDYSSQHLVQEFHYDNIHYYATDCIGFLNSFNALSKATGSFLKLQNNYTMLKCGSLKKIIGDIKRTYDQKPLIFYTNGLALCRCKNEYCFFDDFISHLSYLSSWSSGFGIWKDDFESVKTIQLDKMFPQTSLLLAQSYKDNFIVDDTPIFTNQKVPQKGGYNLFKVFSVDYLSLIEQANKEEIITDKTFKKIKSDLLYKYLSIRYLKTVIFKLDNFEYSNIKKNFQIYYSMANYYTMIFYSFVGVFKILIRKFKCGEKL